MILPILAFVLGAWVGSGLLWWKIDCNDLSPRRRLWRAVTYMPFLILPAWCWRWLP
jgi:hypothetical protein